MTESAACLDRDCLRALLDDTLPPPVADACLRHLDDCPECQREFASLKPPQRVGPKLFGGRSLADKLAAEPRLPLADVLRIGMQTAQALAAAHESGLVYGRLHPSNVLLDEHDGPVRIADLELDDAAFEPSGHAPGTSEYLSPEQVQGLPVDARADLFGLGVLLHRMCTGQSPFAAATAAATRRRVREFKPPRVTEINPEATAWLAAVIERLLQHNPDDRYSTAAEVADSLRRQLEAVGRPRRPAPRTIEPGEVPGSRFAALPVADSQSPVTPPPKTVDMPPPVEIFARVAPARRAKTPRRRRRSWLLIGLAMLGLLIAGRLAYDSLGTRFSGPHTAARAANDPFAVTRFEDHSPTQTPLIGLETTIHNVGQRTAITSIRPIYAGSPPIIGQKVYGEPTGRVANLIAKPGYALGAIRLSKEHSISGMVLIFMRIQGTSLDVNDAYESAWIGVESGSEHKVGGDGALMTGIDGMYDTEMEWLGLIRMRDASPKPEYARRTAKKSSARSIQLASAADAAEIEPATDRLPCDAALGIRSIEPAAGIVGDKIAIFGNGLASTQRVVFYVGNVGKSAAFDIISEHELKATAPEWLMAGSIAQIVVETHKGVTTSFPRDFVSSDDKQTATRYRMADQPRFVLVRGGRSYRSSDAAVVIESGGSLTSTALERHDRCRHGPYFVHHGGVADIPARQLVIYAEPRAILSGNTRSDARVIETPRITLSDAGVFTYAACPLPADDAFIPRLPKIDAIEPQLARPADVVTVSGEGLATTTEVELVSAPGSTLAAGFRVLDDRRLAVEIPSELLGFTDGLARTYPCQIAITTKLGVALATSNGRVVSIDEPYSNNVNDGVAWINRDGVFSGTTGVLFVEPGGIVLDTGSAPFILVRGGGRLDARQWLPGKIYYEPGALVMKAGGPGFHWIEVPHVACFPLREPLEFVNRLADP